MDSGTDPVHALRQARTIAIVGLSDNPDRDSHSIGRYLTEQGYTVYPVNPALKSVLGLKCYARLADIPDHIDIVDVFRRPEYALDIVEQAIKAGAGAVWFQPGTTDPLAVQAAEAAGLAAFPETCIRVIHSRMKYIEAGQ